MYVRHGDLLESAARERALRDIAVDVTRGLVLTEGIATMMRLEVLEDLVERMPTVFNYWIADTILIQPQSNPIVENTGERSSRISMTPNVILEAFERGRWRSIQFLPVNTGSIECARPGSLLG